MTAFQVFPIINLFLPKVPHIEYCHIGSRSYMDAPLSDYDFMFHHYDREHIIEHLINLGVKLTGDKAKGPVKFYVDISFNSSVKPGELNFCFIRDYEAWKKATEAMVAISNNAGKHVFEKMDKESRIKVFESLVTSFGGSQPCKSGYQGVEYDLNF